MKAINIKQWEKIDHFLNYQCRFLAGQANAHKAIDILEDKFEWVGLTEEFEIGIQSFKSYFNIDDQYFNTKISNRITADIEDKKKTKEKFAEIEYNEDSLQVNYEVFNHTAYLSCEDIPDELFENFRVINVDI